MDRKAAIRTSDRIAFRRCRRAWNWSSALRDNLEAEDRPIYFWTGTGMHYALEDYHGPRVYNSPADAFRAYSWAHRVAPKLQRPDGWQDEHVMVTGMMDHYVNWLEQGRDPIQTYYENGLPQVEVHFEISLPYKDFLPSHLADLYDDVVYQGTFDRVGIDEDGFLWIVEYKSARRFETRHLETDAQVTAYCWAASVLYDRPIGGVIYQQHLKQVPNSPRLLSTGRLSADAKQNTTAALYEAALRNIYVTADRAPTQNINCLEALRELEKPNADKFIRRDIAMRTPDQIQAEAIKIAQEAQEMLDPNLLLYPNPTRDCSWQCRLWTACVLQDDGGDYEHEIAMTTVSRSSTSPSETQDTQDETSWRKYLPSPQELEQLRQKEEQLGRLQ